MSIPICYKMCLPILVGFGGVPAMLPSDAEMKSQSSLLNGTSVAGRPPPAPVGLPHHLRFQQQQLQQQLQQRAVQFYKILLSGMPYIA